MTLTLVPAATVLAAGTTASATPVELAGVGWWATRDGVVHCVVDDNHLVCDWFTVGWSAPAVVDLWLPWWCQFAGVTAGDWVSEPARIRFAPPAGSGLACVTGSDGAATWANQFYGWSNGWWAAGQAWWAGWRVNPTAWQVPFRGDSNQGTILEVW